ncbi:MAG: penicillin-binding protein 2 [Alphaproteobacteria bacterium]|jgi:cell division protein FtsI (penicillin-binding protein 3)|nr:penicillin-binding protein 2 [Alphaproteobacteria bacterium]
MKHFIKRPFLSVAKHLSLWHQVVHQRSLLEMARQRVFVAGSLVAVAYLLICGRLVDVMVLRSSKNVSHAISEQITTLRRADIIDRNGEILATHLVTASIYANPKVILNAKEAAEKLAKVLPEVGFEVLYQRLSSAKGFVWLARHLPPKLQQAINQMGIPGVYLQKDHRRVYPYGKLASHVLGYCGIDSNGLAGVEKHFDAQLQKSNEPLQLSIDVRVQHVVYDEMSKAITEFGAIGGNAMVMDLQSGELISMVSFPGFDPNQPTQGAQDATFNRNTLGVFEPGSTFKILNTAIALEAGTATLNSRYDATHPISIGRFTITDFRGKNRVLSFAESFIYSSNIAAIKISQEFGIATQKAYLKKFGIFKAATLEIPELGHPLIPTTWREPTSMTVSYGYGISVTPLQLISTIGGIINNGILPQPTLLHKDVRQREEVIKANKAKEPIVSEKTSRIIRDLMRIIVREGPSKKANVDGYQVIGKTGTAYKIQGKSYATGKARTTFFVGAFPHKSPRYIVLLLLDDPKPTKNTYGFAAAGWNAAPTAGKIIERMAPILGLHATEEDSESSQAPKGWVNVSHVTSTHESVNGSE